MHYMTFFYFDRVGLRMTRAGLRVGAWRVLKSVSVPQGYQQNILKTIFCVTVLTRRKLTPGDFFTPRAALDEWINTRPREWGDSGVGYGGSD